MVRVVCRCTECHGDFPFDPSDPDLFSFLVPIRPLQVPKDHQLEGLADAARVHGPEAAEALGTVIDALAGLRRPPGGGGFGFLCPACRGKAGAIPPTTEKS